MNCLQCGTYTNNPKFCSSSCSAKYNNTRRKKKQYFCRDCGTLLGEGYIFKDRVVCENVIKAMLIGQP